MSFNGSCARSSHICGDVRWWGGLCALSSQSWADVRWRRDKTRLWCKSKASFLLFGVDRVRLFPSAIASAPRRLGNIGARARLSTILGVKEVAPRSLLAFSTTF